LRPAVIWRRTSFEAQSQAGSEFTARMLTVVTGLRAHATNLVSRLIFDSGISSTSTSTKLQKTWMLF